MPLIDPAIDNLYREKITELITGLSDKYVIECEYEDGSRCPNCRFDSSGGAGSGVYNGTGPTPFTKVCPVCRNAGKVATVVRQEITATAKVADAKQGNKPDPGGDLPEGHARIKGLEEDNELLERCQVFYIDGVRYNRQGEINRRGLLSKVVNIIIVKRSD